MKKIRSEKDFGKNIIQCYLKEDVIYAYPFGILERHGSTIKKVYGKQTWT